jgi:hypothetical protein
LTDQDNPVVDAWVIPCLRRLATLSLLFLVAGPMSAQANLTPVDAVPLPGGHNYIIGLNIQTGDLPKLILSTINDGWEAPLVLNTILVKVFDPTLGVSACLRNRS